MKRFMKNIPGQITFIFTIMMVTFTLITLGRGTGMVPVTRVLELFLLSIVGGIWMEFAFGTCIVKQMAEAKRICIFIIPFAVVTLICAVTFQWITELQVIGTYVRFAGIFIGGWVLSIVLSEIEHWIRGKKYTKKLREYQTAASRTTH